MTDLGERILLLREALGLTQAELAARVGVSQPTVYKWEKQGLGISEKALDKLAALAGITKSEFRYGPVPHRIAPKMVDVWGYVLPGGEIHYAEEPVEKAEMPSDWAGGIVAIRVQDQSSFMAGWTLYYRNTKTVPPRAIGKLCVVKLRHGATFLRTLLPGRRQGIYTVTSFMGQVSPDVEVDWAAPIEWLRTASGAEG